jgi:hypothetical protein
MSYKIAYNNRPDYLHAVITGTCTKESVAGYLEEVLRKCIEIGTKQIFIEQRLDGPRLETDTVYQIASSISTNALASGVFEAIAFVDVNAESVLNLKFAESVAANRGLPVKVFFSVNDAEHWLNNLKK